MEGALAEVGGIPVLSDLSLNVCSGTTLCQLNTASQFNQFSLDNNIADTLAD